MTRLFLRDPVSAVKPTSAAGEELVLPKPLGRACFWITWSDLVGAGYANFFNPDEVGDYRFVSSVDDADFIVLSGVETVFGSDLFFDFEVSGDSSALDPYLKAAAERNLPMIVSNPDNFVVRPDGSRAHLTGLLATRYAELGGTPWYFGKPYPSSFAAARAALPEGRLAHVGDSLEHDIAGANAAGVDSIWVVDT